MNTDLHIVVGLGATGLSCVDYLIKQGIHVAVVDSRANPPNLAKFKTIHPEIEVTGIDEAVLEKAVRIILSPGVALSEPAIAKQIKRGTPVVGDIELFAQATKVPVMAITGTNAKSTVTTLVAYMAEEAGQHVKVGGNLGIPALQLLDPIGKNEIAKDSKLAHAQLTNLFVLELSSFQLETTYSLAAQVATILNITPDHMDRYSSLTAYTQAKQRIYENCRVAICNRDDKLTECRKSGVQQKYHFTLNAPRADEFGLVAKQGETYLAYEDEILLPVSELPLKGRHAYANALAALAIGHGYGLPFESMLAVLKRFTGLPHRCQFVGEHHQVSWYNDSKGTNVGATLAAIQGLGSEIPGKLILIAGGVGKRADFSPLGPVIEKYCRVVVLIGEAANDLADVIAKRVPVLFASTMEEAVQKADQAAQPFDAVLLSPACASFDMFEHFVHRGEVFMEIVERLFHA